MNWIKIFDKNNNKQQVINILIEAKSFNIINSKFIDILIKKYSSYWDNDNFFQREDINNLVYNLNYIVEKKLTNDYLKKTQSIQWNNNLIIAYEYTSLLNDIVSEHNLETKKMEEILRKSNIIEQSKQNEKLEKEKEISELKELLDNM